MFTPFRRRFCKAIYKSLRYDFSDNKSYVIQKI